MYKRIDFTQLEGLPLTQNTLKFLQDGYRDTVVGIASVLGDFVIVSGVADLGANYGDGWVIYNGELLPFVGGVKAAQVVTEETAVGKIYGDGATRNAWFTKVAKSGVAGGTPHANFVRLYTLAEVKADLDTIRQRLTAPVEKVANHILELTDLNKGIEMNLAGANTVTVPPNADVAFAVGTTINVVQKGAGKTTIVAGAGVTLLSEASLLSIGARYTGVVLWKVAVNTWYVLGNVSA